METTEVAELKLPGIQKSFTDHLQEVVHHAEVSLSDDHVYSSGRGYYIWYKDSIPDEIDTSILSDEYELLYRSVNYTEYKSRLNIYVSVYSVCLTVVLLMLITFPFLPDALAKFQANKSVNIAVSQGDQLLQDNTVDRTKQSAEIVEGMGRNSIGFTDLRNNVIYIVLPNGRYSIQESSWNNEQKAASRVNKLNSLSLKDQKGKTIKALFEKTDLKSKGVWFRTRIGEFATMKEAIQNAGMIRSLGKAENIASIFIFPESNLKV